MAVDLETPLEEPVAPPPPPPEPPEAWQVDKQGREYVKRKDGRPGIIVRQGEETIEQARERDAAGPKDRRPRRKTKTPKMPEPPKQLDLKALEAALTEALKTPALACAMVGDQWAADHFTQTGPYLARNLILASEHNPWLRRKLEEMATGGDAMMTVISLVPVIGGLMLYFVPPVIYWFNLPVPDQTRQRFGIPPRKEQTPAYAAAAQPESAPVPPGIIPFPS
jgi:hypothetical protein